MCSLVSVVMTVYNGEKYLAEAIDSILGQTYFPIELVIVDDGSQDSTRQIIGKYGSKVHYFWQSNQGQPVAVNQGIRISNGLYITFLDADDLYVPAKISLQVEFLEKNPQFDCVFGHVEQFHSPELMQNMKKWDCPTALSPGYLAAAGLFKKECFERVGLFNEEQRIGVFIEWYMRATELGIKEGMLLEKVLRRRIHDNNMGIQAQSSRLEYVKIVKAALKRRSAHV